MSQSSPSGFPSSDIPRIRSPLQYPGGKYFAVPHIVKQFPRGIDTLVSPFLGGGSIELSCAAMGIKVYGYDAFEPLVNFWQCAISDSRKVAEYVKELLPLGRSAFYLHRSWLRWSGSFGFDQAVVFYALNRTAWAGKIYNGYANEEKFNDAGLKRLASFKVDNLTVQLADCRDEIPKHNGQFLYLDPPYPMNREYYGFHNGEMHRDFDHESLADMLHSRENWILSYNDCPKIRRLYAGFTKLNGDWSYKMGNKPSNELLIFSPDLSPNE